jgi:hypothetical protein
MPFRITKYQPTPNPNAVKCFLGPRSFRTVAEGAADPTAAPLLAVPGVSGLLLNGDWLTVNKSPDADWPAIKRGIEKALHALGEG